MPAKPPPPNAAGPQALVSELGYTTTQGANWSSYLKYRPLYPPSFYAQIFTYHTSKPHTSYHQAHDVGSGSGIVASTLATKFTHTIVTDPNDGYVTLARRLLCIDSQLPASQFRFLQEKAEHSSVRTSSVDLITICAAIHWTDTDATIREFARELRARGTLAVAHYSRPWIVGNERAAGAWNRIWKEWMRRTQGEAFERAFWIVQSGNETVAFPKSAWCDVKRIYINAEGRRESFLIAEGDHRVGVERVGREEQRIWIQGAEEWCEWRGIAFFKGYLSTWLPPIPEEELGDLWMELEDALGGGEVKIRTPVVLILATRRGGGWVRRVVRGLREKFGRVGMACGMMKKGKM